MFKKIRDFFKDKTGEKKDLNFLQGSNLEGVCEYLHMTISGSSCCQKEIKKMYEHMDTMCEHYFSCTDQDIKEIFSFSDCDEIYSKFGSYTKIFKLNKFKCLYPITLVPDFSNELHPNTIKVMATLNNEELLLGYIPKIHKKKILENFNYIISAEVFPIGGKYKYTEIQRNELVIKTGEDPYTLGLKIFLQWD